MISALPFLPLLQAKKVSLLPGDLASMPYHFSTSGMEFLGGILSISRYFHCNVKTFSLYISNDIFVIILQFPNPDKFPFPVSHFRSVGWSHVGGEGEGGGENKFEWVVNRLAKAKTCII